MNWRTVVSGLLLLHSSVDLHASSDQRAFISPHANRGSAVDARGKIYRAVDYRGKPPWMLDAIYTVAPDYPRSERRQHHAGNPEVRLRLDLKTGKVVDAVLLRSCGYSVLDRNAVSAMRQWRWKPGKWQQITIGVAFRIRDVSSPLPPGAIPIQESQ